jgi:hypothetical protein
MNLMHGIFESRHPDTGTGSLSLAFASWEVGMRERESVVQGCIRAVAVSPVNEASVNESF